MNSQLRDAQLDIINRYGLEHDTDPFELDEIAVLENEDMDNALNH